MGTPGWLTLGMTAATICSLIGSAAFASTLVELSRTWHLDARQAGWISSAYYIGYAATVPLLVSLTDRVKPRVIYLAGCGIGVIGGVAFALLAQGTMSAMFFQALSGIGLAGTYMPGLRVLTERLGPHVRGRAVPYYTAGFGIGSSLDFLMSGWLAARYGWRVPYGAGAVASLCAAGCMLAATAMHGSQYSDAASTNAEAGIFDFRAVFQDRRALRFVIAYGGHCWELFALRAWLPAYLLFAWGTRPADGLRLSIARWAMVITMVGVPSSLIGAELDRRRMSGTVVGRIAVAAFIVSLFTVPIGSISFGFAIAAVLLYSALISADSGTLSSLALAAAPIKRDGAMLAMYSCGGFIGASLGPLVAGIALDLFGGRQNVDSWFVAFAVMGVGSAIAALAIPRILQPSGQSA